MNMNKEIKEKISSYMDKKQDDLYAELSKLIQFDTTDKIAYGQEEKCQQYVYDQYKQLGYPVDSYYLTEVDSLKDHADFLANRGA